MNNAKSTRQRSYVKVSDAQRQVLIELMLQNQNLTLRDASNITQVNYESAKAIWTVYRKQGRSQSLKSKAVQRTVASAQSSASNDSVMAAFDTTSKLNESRWLSRRG